MMVPPRFTQSIESWLQDLTTTTYFFRASPIQDPIIRTTVYIGDIHADPRGLITALYISHLINRWGRWKGGNQRVVLLGDVLDGAERNGTNPSITPWDEILCLRIIFSLKQEAQRNGGDLIWVLGNHDLAAVFGQDMYLNPIQAKGYLPHTRRDWFSPGKGILAFYMAHCGILAGIIGTTLVSHAGLCKKHIENGAIARGANGMTGRMRRFLMKGNTTQEELNSWYSMDGVMMHRVFDIKPYVSVPMKVKQELNDVKAFTGIHIQLIGHNHRPGIQKLSIDNNLLFFTDTGISQSFGPNAKVQCLRIHQSDGTFKAYSVQSNPEQKLIYTK